MKNGELPYGICCTLFEKANEGLLVLGEDLTILAFNPGAEKLLGARAKHISGEPVARFIKPAGYLEFVSCCETCRSAEVAEARIIFAPGNGGVLYSHARFFSHNENGRNFILVLFRDTGADGHAQDQFFKLFYTSPVAKVITDTETATFVDVNDGFLELIGYPRNAVIGKTSVELGFIHPRQELILKELRENGHIHNLEITAQSRSGKTLYLLLSVEKIAIREKDYFLISHIDITEKKNAEHEILALKDFMQNVLENTSDGFVSFDRDWKYLYVNRNACLLLGKPAEELIGKCIWDVFPNMAGSEFESQLRLAMDERKTVSFEGTRPVNNEVWLHVKANPIEQGLAVFFTVITEKKLAEQAMLQLNEELDKRVRERTMELTTLLEREKAINEMKSRFVSMASHEFRTPLSTLLSSLNILEMYVKPAADSKEQKHIVRIKSSVEQLTEILNDFLSLDKLENGKLEIKNVEMDLDTFAEELLAGFNPLLRTGQRIDYNFSGTKKAVLDKSIFQNLISNLVSNSIKFSPVNTTIGLQIENCDGAVRLCVKDEGMGIPPEEQQYLFTRLFRASNAINVSGTGLGLNIVKRYVELLGGEISFESRVNEGSEFNIMLPVQAPVL